MCHICTESHLITRPPPSSSMSCHRPPSCEILGFWASKAGGGMNPACASSLCFTLARFQTPLSATWDVDGRFFPVRVFPASVPSASARACPPVDEAVWPDTLPHAWTTRSHPRQPPTPPLCVDTSALFNLFILVLLCSVCVSFPFRVCFIS